MHCRVERWRSFRHGRFAVGKRVSTYFYIIHFFDIGISAMGWMGEPSGQAGQKNMAIIAVLLCRLHR